MKVFLHTRSEGKYDWNNEYRDFAQIPNVGDYLALNSGSPWYLVQVIVYTPFPCDVEAEVYAVEVDHNVVKKQAFHDIS